MRYFTILAVLFGFVACDAPKTEKKMKLNYPETAKVDTVDEYFGTKVPDPYRWLEDDNSEETKAWVKAQNEVTFGFLNQIPFRNKIKERLTKVWNYEKRSAPSKRGEKYYFYKNDGLQNQSVMYVQAELGGNAEVFFDPNKLSEDGTVALSSTSFSKDGKYMAYSIARGGSDWNEIYVMETESKEVLKDHIKWMKFSGMSWYKDGFFYSAYDAPKEGDKLKGKNEFQKVYYHKIGTEQSEDKLIFEDKEHPQRGFYASTTENEKYLVLSAWEGTDGGILFVKDLTKDGAEFIQINKDFSNNHSVVGEENDQLLILTNAGASKYRLVTADVNTPQQENWKDLIPESEDLLQSCGVVGGKLFATYLKDVHTEIKAFSLDGKFQHDVKLPGIGTASSINGDRDENIAFYTYTSYTTPTKIFKYDIAANKSEEFFAPKVDFDPSQYEAKQVFFTSKDGTKIPMEIVHKKGIALDGTNPTLMYGYGGFNVIYEPDFRSSRIPWIENGGIYVNVHMRGGGEYGEDWHKAGTKMEKQNVFDDFIAAGEYLVKEKYTSPEKLAILGGSNGGLLVGAVVNQRPDLFKVAFPAVGVMDMLRYHKFTIGWAWATDYGRSDDSKEMFEYLYGYSPIHTVKENVEYPAVMVTTADHDDRVVPAHSFKYIAALQAAYKGNNPVVIRIETKAGHGAGKPTSKQIEENADMWAFAFYNMGIEPYTDMK